MLPGIRTLGSAPGAGVIPNRTTPVMLMRKTSVASGWESWIPKN